MKDIRVFKDGLELGRLRIDSISADKNSNITVMETYYLDDRSPDMSGDDLAEKISLASEFKKLPFNLGEMIEWASDNSADMVMEDSAGKAPSEVLVGDITAFTTASPLPGGTNGVAYNQTVAVTTTVGGTHLSVIKGSLPTGLSINASTGAITGTAGAVGTFVFTLKLVDTGLGSLTAIKEYSITIA